MSKKNTKLISLVLVLAILFNTTFYVSATSVDATKTAQSSAELNPKPAIVLSSITDKDGYLTDDALINLESLPYEEEKYKDIIDNGDGTKTLKLFTEPIKYENEDGVFEVIDNSITFVDGKDGSKQYKNKASDIQVVMSDNLDQSNAIEMSFDDYSIGFKPLELFKENGKSTTEMSFINTPNLYIGEQKNETLDETKKNESVEYSKTFNTDASIKITPNSTGVKEDIIFNTMPNEKEFAYELTVANAVPVLRKDGNLYFIDLEKGLLVAAIASPFMYDSSLETKESYDIAVKLEKTGENTYKYTLIPDRKFLEDKTTVYPVVLDPSVNTTSSMLHDTFISSLYSGNNYYNDPSLKIGFCPTYSVSRGLIKINQFPSEVLPGSGYAVTNVQYCAYQDYAGTSNVRMDVHNISTYWDVTTVKYSNKPTLGSLINSQYVANVGMYYWDVTAYAQGWINGTVPNYGIYLKIVNEAANYYKRFNSSNNATLPNYFAFTIVDTTPPPQPATATVSGSSFSGPTGSITYSWPTVVDLPSGFASGVDHYEIAHCLNGSWYTYLSVGSATSYTFYGCPDNATYDFAVRAVDANNNVGAYRYQGGFTSPDRTGPIAPTSFTISPTTWTNALNLTLAWSGITDEGNHLAQAQYKVDSGAWTNIGTNYGISSGSLSISTTGIADGAHTISLRAVDSIGNAGTAASCTYYKDSTAPSLSMSVSDMQPNGIVYVTATVANSAGSSFSNWVLEYGPGNPAASFTTLCTAATTVNNQVIYEWDTSALPENTWYTLRLRASDASNNQSTPAQLTFLKASGSIAVNAGLQIDQLGIYEADGYKPDIGNVDDYMFSIPSIAVLFQKASSGGILGLSPGKLYVSNKLHDTETTAGEGLNFNAAAYDNGWVYPEGSLAFLYVQAKDATTGELYSTGTYAALEICDTFDNSSKVENLNQTILSGSSVKLSQTAGIYSTTGSAESTNKPFAGDVSYVDLKVSQTVPANASIVYQISVDNGANWQSITPVSTDGGYTINLANREYFTDTPIGDSVKLRATLNKSTTANESPIINSWSVDVRYTTYANAVLVDNTFPENARGITELDRSTHDQTNCSIRLSVNPVSFYLEQEGSVCSTIRNTSNDVIEACLEVEQNIPANSSIVYKISADNGMNWQVITPCAPNGSVNLSNWFAVTNPGTQVQIKAELTGNGIVTPELQSWRLVIKEKIAGDPHMIKLVDEPWNLSTITGANYMTLLRWEASTSENVLYNVYRSETPYFVPSAATLAAEGISETSWNDYNLNYGKTFYYQVTAVKSINGHNRESLPSNQAWATVVSEDEMNKRIGLQNYWSFSGFKTGSGTGYVNVSNGNMAYITTDMVLSDPFFATVMRRTFNSMADTKTAMGYGWDFSFNTCLLKEFDGTNEVAMILKDGDGSFHQFAKKIDGTYETAKGTFMTLTYNSALDEYQIKRKDNIVYHFDAQSMKLKSFTDNNNNQLNFTYNTRGSLCEVANIAGEKMTLTYYVEGAAPTDPDYTYVNYNPDMLATVTWTENTETNPVSTTYNYEYNSDDRLNRAYTTIEGNTIYEENFGYDQTTGELISITDPKDTVTGISYAANGRVNRITDANADYYDVVYTLDAYNVPISTSIINKYGVGVSYDYNVDGVVTKKTDALGHSIDYTTNTSNQVTDMSYMNTVNGGTTPVEISGSYTYDASGNILTITGDDGQLTEYHNYNSFNKPASVTVIKDGKTLTTTYTYDTNGNLLASTDPEGKLTINTYSTVNGHAGYLTQVENDFGGQTRYNYDSKGRVSHIDIYDNGTFVSTKATYAYECNIDGYFMRVTVTDGMGNSTKKYYDQLGRTVKVVYPDNLFEVMDYDLVGNVLRSTDRAGSEVDYTYDSLYRPTVVTLPDETTNTVEYLKWDSVSNIGDASGNDADKVVKTDATGIQSIEYYDIAGRLLRTSVKNGTSELITAQYAYDMIGNCIQVTDNAGRVSQALYNELGQTTTTIVDPNGENIQTSYIYDMMGNKLSVTDGENNTTSYVYDDDARLQGVSQTVGASTLTTGYTYDIEEGGYIKNRVTDAKGNVSEAWFDAIGRKIKDYNVGDTGDSTVMQTSYSYNNNFQVTLVTRNDGTKEKCTYNILGQVARVDYYESSESTAADSDDYIVYQYNSNGQATQSSVYHPSSEETTGYTYDIMGRVKQLVQGDTGGVLSVNYDYDSAGRVTEISYAKDDTMRKLGYEYDTFGRIHYITLATGPDLENTVFDKQTVREYVYKTNGDLDYIKNYRGFASEGDDYIKTAYEINSAGLTTKITYSDHLNGSETGTTKEEYTLTYDDRGFITGETAYTNYTTAQTTNKSYAYDAIGRLTQSTIGSETSNYTYDNVGNRLSVSDSTGDYDYQYNQFNQLTAVTKNNSAYIDYTYDGRGNQTQEIQKYLTVTVGQTSTTYNKTTNYGYDLSNQLTMLSSSTPTANAQGIVTYIDESTVNKYNAAGQRIKKIENDQTTKYYYSGSTVLYTTNVNNFLLTENILDLGGSIIASRRFAGEIPNPNDPYAGDYFFYNYDRRGSTTAIVQPDGTLIKGYSYDEFGSQTKTGATDFLNEVTFTGSVSDTSSGMQYMNARFYNPSTGRFLSQDTYSGNAYDPWTQNLYSYCGNNPVNMVDPTGHFFNLIAGAIGAGVGAIVGITGQLVSDTISGNTTDWNTIGAAAAAGAITGLAAGVTCGASLAVTAACYGTFAVAGSVAGQSISKGGIQNVDNLEALGTGLTTAATAGMFHYAFNIKPTLKFNEIPSSSSSTSKSLNTSASSNSSTSSNTIKTPYGNAVQSTSKEALQLKQSIENGGQLYRAGTFGKSNTAEAQFWAPESPLNPGYAEKYGVAFPKLDFIIGGKQISGSPFVTRYAPGLGGNAGGELEIVNNPNSVKLNFFHVP